MAKVCERLMAMAIEWEEAKMHNNPWSRGQNLPMVDAHLAEVKNIDDKRKLGTKKTVKAHREEKPRSKVLPPHRQPSTSLSVRFHHQWQLLLRFPYQTYFPFPNSSTPPMLLCFLLSRSSSTLFAWSSPFEASMARASTFSIDCIESMKDSICWSTEAPDVSSLFSRWQRVIDAQL